jgi:hypothetical protein
MWLREMCIERMLFWKKRSWWREEVEKEESEGFYR